MSAANGKECQEYVATMSPDLVVLDIRMPGMDGVEVLQWINDNHPGLPVVINTAFNSYKSNYMTWIADAFLTKTADVSVLVHCVRDLLGVKTSLPRHNSSTQKPKEWGHEIPYCFTGPA